MISLNDYLHQGDTVLKILHRYETDLKNTKSEDSIICCIDELHAEYLNGIIKILEHNDFLTSQSQRIKEFYSYMVVNYPYLSFTYKGRIKSLIRSEEKFNRRLMEITEPYLKEGTDLSDILTPDVKDQIMDIRDIIAYRIIISVPRCHVKEGENPHDLEVEALYNIAEQLPRFMKKMQFRPEKIAYAEEKPSSKICEEWRGYYKDFIEYPTKTGYQSLHIVFYDEIARCRFEMQLRTKSMDDYAEIGVANHNLYEQIQKNRNNTLALEKKVPFYREAYQRLQLLHELELSKVDVNMFTAYSNILMNDGCGLYRGRQILPYEHLSRFQNDQIG